MPSVASTDVPALWYVEYNTVQILICLPFKSKQSEKSSIWHYILSLWLNMPVCYEEQCKITQRAVNKKSKTIKYIL